MMGQKQYPMKCPVNGCETSISHLLVRGALGDTYERFEHEASMFADTCHTALRGRLSYCTSEDKIMNSKRTCKIEVTQAIKDDIQTKYPDIVVGGTVDLNLIYDASEPICPEYECEGLSFMLEAIFEFISARSAYGRAWHNYITTPEMKESIKNGLLFAYARVAERCYRCNEWRHNIPF